MANSDENKIPSGVGQKLKDRQKEAGLYAGPTESQPYEGGSYVYMRLR